jgi:O-antigen/teichoic acid export membrane protein
VSFRNLARASALYTVGNFLPRLGAFILLPVYVRFLSRGEFGTVSLITSLAGFLTILYRVGLDGALMRLHFDEVRDRQRALYSTLTWVAVLAAALGSLAAGLILGPFFANLFSGLQFMPYGLLGIGIAAASAVSFAPAVFYRATGRPGLFLLYALAIFVTGSLASVILVLVGWGASGMLIGQLVGAVVGLLVTLVLVLRIAGTRYDPSLVGPALRFGLPLTPHAVSAWALRLADRWLIGLLIGLPAAQALAELGAYSLGYQLGYVITVLVSSFNAAWSPWFFRIGDRSEAPSVFSGMTTVVVAGLMALAVGVSALAPQIVAIIARPEYRSAAGVLPVVAMASVLYGIYTMLSTVVFYAKATGRLAMITVSAAIINVGANVILIPRLGILGAAWATFAAYAFFAIATWRFASTVYTVRLDLVRLAALGGAGIVALLLAGLTDASGAMTGVAVVRLALALAFAAVAAAIAWGPARALLRSPR